MATEASRTARPRLGVLLPSATGDLRPEQLLGLAEAVERAGLDSVWIGDHLIWRVPMLEAVTTLTAISQHTSRVELGFGALLPGLREPLGLAKALASLSWLSGGRLTVGAGAGGDFPIELLATGVAMSERGRSLERNLEIARAVWMNEPYAMTGPTGSIEVPGGLLPESVDIPVLIAGRSRRAVERALSVGDGWIALHYSPAELDRFSSEVRDRAAAAGRPSFRVVLNVWTAAVTGGRLDSALRAMRRIHGAHSQDVLDRSLICAPNEVTAGARALHAAGADDLVAVLPPGLDIGIYEDTIDVLAAGHE